MYFLYQGIHERIFFSQSINKEQFLILNILPYHFLSTYTESHMKKIIFVWKWHNTNLTPSCNTVSWKWKNINLPAFKSRKHVENGVLLYSCVERKGVTFWIYWFFEKINFFNIKISFSSRAMFFTVVKHNEKRHKLFSKSFYSSSLIETKRALRKSKVCWALVARLLPAFCVTSVLTFPWTHFCHYNKRLLKETHLHLGWPRSWTPNRQIQT